MRTFARKRLLAGGYGHQPGRKNSIDNFEKKIRKIPSRLGTWPARALKQTEATRGIGSARRSCQIVRRERPDKRARIHYPEATLKDVKLRIALQRADILLRLSRPGEAVSTLQPAEERLHIRPFILPSGQSTGGTREIRRPAIDAYVEAVVRHLELTRKKQIPRSNPCG